MSLLRTTALLATASASLTLGACANAPSAPSAPSSSALQTPALSAQALLGRWQVDLRPTPGSAPYFQPMDVTQVDGSQFSGRFYGTPFTQGRINGDWGDLRFAFVTADGATEYHHTGTLRAGRLEGLTHAPGRGFLAVWTATRLPPAP